MSIWKLLSVSGLVLVLFCFFMWTKPSKIQLEEKEQQHSNTHRNNKCDFVHGRCGGTRNTLTALPKVFPVINYHWMIIFTQLTANPAQVPCCGLNGKQKRDGSFRTAWFENIDRRRQVNGGRRSMWRWTSWIQRSGRIVSEVLHDKGHSQWLTGETGLLGIVFYVLPTGSY